MEFNEYNNINKEGDLFDFVTNVINSEIAVSTGAVLINFQVKGQKSHPSNFEKDGFLYFLKKLNSNFFFVLQLLVQNKHELNHDIPLGLPENFLR